MRPPRCQGPAMLIAAAGTVIALAGCGTGAAAPSGSDTRSGSGTEVNSDRQSPASFLQRARVVSDRWNLQPTEPRRSQSRLR
jgi:hypothetical protein